METWAIITIISVVVIALLAVVFLLDWKYKCWKTIREYKLTIHLNGYAILRNQETESTLTVYGGVLGLNAGNLVFVNRFQDSSFALRKNIPDITGFEVRKYEENNYIEMLRDNFKLDHERIMFELINMAGYSMDFKLPRLIRSRLLCKVDFDNDISLLFFYKDSPKYNAAIQKMKVFISKNN